MTAALWILDTGLIALVMTMATLALYHPRIFAGALMFISYGLVLALIWLRLGAPDVALAEAAIGSGLTGAMLIGTLARLAKQSRRASAGKKRDDHNG